MEELQIDIKNRTVRNRGTHITHCCRLHGCKYNYEYSTEQYCPVSIGEDIQEYPCEYCVDVEEAQAEIEHIKKEIEFVTNLKAAKLLKEAEKAND